MPWIPPSRGDRPEEHPDLQTARTLTGVINKVTSESAPRLLDKLRHLSVQTEYGLYLLVDAVFRAALERPKMAETLADVCGILCNVQVGFNGKYLFAKSCTRCVFVTIAYCVCFLLTH